MRRKYKGPCLTNHYRPHPNGLRLCDACMGDIVMFEQTVYEGYNIASRSATGPPCGKRIVAGRIVKESYGAAKQHHTFTVEVLWSKGHKPLPPLHPLLIKGRNLYRLNTLRRRWEDESERQRVLSEEYCRDSLTRSSREARIQGKISKKMLKGARVYPKERQHICQEKNHRLATGPISNNSFLVLMLVLRLCSMSTLSLSS